MPVIASEELADDSDEILHPSQIIVIDDDDAHRKDIFETRRQAANFCLRALRLVMQYKGNKEMANRCLAFALEDYDMAGGQTAVEIAVLLFADKKKKAAVSKCIGQFELALGLPPTQGQRKIAGRKQMSAARKEQLK